MKTRLIQQSYAQKTYAIVFYPGDDVMAGLQTLVNSFSLSPSQFMVTGALPEGARRRFRWAKRRHRDARINVGVEVSLVTGDDWAGESMEPRVCARVVVNRLDVAEKAQRPNLA